MSINLFYLYSKNTLLLSIDVAFMPHRCRKNAIILYGLIVNRKVFWGLCQADNSSISRAAAAGMSSASVTAVTTDARRMPAALKILTCSNPTPPSA